MTTEQQSYRSSVDLADVARVGACAALLGSAVVHATVVGEHYEEWALAGLFFVGLEVVEVLLCIAVVMAWSRRVAALVVLVSAGTLAIWALSRTLGMPVGPESIRSPEAVGVPDLACVVLEVVAAVLVLPWALRRRTGPAGDGTTHRAAVLPSAAVVLLVLAVTGWGLGPALSGEPEHTHGDDHEHSSAESQPLGHR